MQPWVADEMGEVKLRDQRHKQRLIQMIDQITERPAASIPVACGTWLATKAAYRCFGPKRVETKAILEGHEAKTIQRMAGEDCIFVAQDTTELNYTSHKKTEGLGELRLKGELGLYVHSRLAISLQGIPLGLVHQETWGRMLQPERTKYERQSTATAEKENQRWIRMQQACEKAIPAEKTVVPIADREADMYVLLATQRRASFICSSVLFKTGG